MSKPLGQGSETATGTANVVLARSVDASGIALDCRDVQGAVDGRLRGQWSSRDQREDMLPRQLPKYCSRQLRIVRQQGGDNCQCSVLGCTTRTLHKAGAIPAPQHPTGACIQNTLARTPVYIRRLAQDPSIKNGGSCCWRSGYIQVRPESHLTMTLHQFLRTNQGVFCCHSSNSAATTFTCVTNRQTSHPPHFSPTPHCGMQLSSSHRRLKALPMMRRPYSRFSASM